MYESPIPTDFLFGTFVHKGSRALVHCITLYADWLCFQLYPQLGTTHGMCAPLPRRGHDLVVLCTYGQARCLGVAPM